MDREAMSLVLEGRDLSLDGFKLVCTNQLQALG